MNLNVFAREITLQEGLKKSMSIAQVKEVIRLVLTELANNYSPEKAAKIISRYRGK